MKKYYLQAGVVLLSLFLSVTAAMAQTTTISGVVRTEIDVKEGKVTIILPDDMRTGDAISGTVMAEPNGNTAKEKARNREALSKYKVMVAGLEFLMAGGRQLIKFIMAPGTKVSVVNYRSAEVGNFMVPTTTHPLVVANVVTLPSHALTGAPVRIRGNFDGDMSNTKCRLDGKPMEIVAESPRETICTMPQTASGQHNITVEEKGKTTAKKISAVNMDMSAPKTNLKTGEQVEITVAVSGLEGISSNASIILTNTSPGTINLRGGNTQTIIINPAQVINSGSYSQTFTAQSLSTGAFSVNADLHLPETSSAAITLVQPGLITPANGEIIEDKKGDKPKFSWIPSSSTGGTPIKYRLRIVPVYPGQETGEAFRNNTPVTDSIISGTNFESPGTLPFWATGQAYGWGVSALDEYGNPYFAANPFSTPNKFTAGDKPMQNPAQAKDDDKKKDCDKEKAELDAAKDALKNAQANLANAQQALNDWNKKNETALQYYKQRTGELQKDAAQATTKAGRAAANKAVEEMDAKRQELNAQRTALMNAINAAQTAVAAAAANLKEKEDAYNKCAGK